MTLHLSTAELRLRQKAQIKLWRLEHPEKVRAYHHVHALKPEAIVRKRQWARDNRERINTCRRAMYKNARATQAAASVESSQEPTGRECAPP
jgi:hypothetical protein